MKSIIQIKWRWVLPAIALSIGFAGCKKNFLDREPLGQYTQDDLGGSSLEAQVFGMYAGLRAEGVSGVKFIAVHSIRSDDADKGSTTSDGVDTENFFDNFQYTKNFWLLNDYWGDHYRLIKLTNDVIDAVNELPSPNPAEIVNRAEAKFLRAYAYFNLVRAYGDVPKIDFKVESAAEGNVPKSPAAAIYTLIDADLQEAVANLPLSWEPQFIGRLTKGAALALQAKTFITRAQWAQALASAKAVIATGQYNLSTPYSRIFTQEGENSSESVFEIQAFYSPTQTNLGLQYATVQGVRGAGAMDLGWGWNTPTASLANAFEANDPRKDATLLYAGQVNQPYGEAIPAPTANLPRQWWNKKVYTNPAVRAANNSRFGQWVNMRVIRYADVLLWAAEAANELGGTQNTADALMWLEMVRARARMGAPAGTLPQVTTTDQAQLRQKIREERRVEFGMEHERFYDLVRWGIAEAVFQAQGKNYQPKNRYLPIPQPEIDKSNGVLVQNPDYM